jgi:hypothetical protein
MDGRKYNRIGADIQNNIVNAERRGKRQVMIRPSSKVVVKVLAVMQKHGKSRFASLLFQEPIPIHQSGE